MDYAAFAEHTERYSINGVTYTVTANFVTNSIMIKAPVYFAKVDMKHYEEFEGDMKEFVTDLIGAKTCE